MPRFAIATFLAALAGTAGASGSFPGAAGPATGPEAGPARATVNLNRPGALDALRRESPDRYAKVTEVIRAAQQVPCDTQAIRLMKATYELRDMYCGFLLMTSLPPKRHLSFAIEDARYTATVTMTYEPGRVMKAGEAR